MTIGPLRRLLSALARIARAWWSADRIRVSLRPGRLLRLEPGSALRVRGVPAVVVLRQVGETPAGRYVAYDCDAVGGPARLVVRLAGDCKRSLVTWTIAGRDVDLQEEAIETFPARRGSADVGAR